MPDSNVVPAAAAAAPPVISPEVLAVLNAFSTNIMSQVTEALVASSNTQRSYLRSVLGDLPEVNSAEHQFQVPFVPVQTEVVGAAIENIVSETVAQAAESDDKSGLVQENSSSILDDMETN